MQRFDHLLTTRPHDINAVFVSDLHLSSDTPALNEAFLALVQDLSVLPNLQSLYILGDWLDGWIGDDDYLTLSDDKKARHFLTPILNALKTLSTNTAIYVMHGNRDFAIRQSLCDTFNGKLIKEPHFLTLQDDTHIRLEHGDRLCTDDKAYQRYRKIIQNPVISWLILKQPLAHRQRLAHNIKTKSQSDKHQKSTTIMDVNAQAVNHAMQTCNILLHGHTHRPAVHTLGDKKRMVLGDWRYIDDKVQAVIGAVDSDGVGLWVFDWFVK
ncbi:MULTISPECIES: UDP-2,3-diacylglucosamine diphosphatase [Moraxella]|uniref:UDP-2,3-diacylglucosamine hydrolase n=1 Tax=Moraxella lacunata TaxID=477 RepID=A0A1B8PVN2_MORLA|nr:MULTISPECIES: UDP-2,3-diacylglucosamine diphosphatase [Moraxella]MBE9579225.1 UDP-2,3-diacylglucosamine diphosphatase [Moraxella sp. K1664]MBE9588599.1 UDP-2,3-diacylglucosamine diphosphatase [Moraxella sp. K1630]MBE9596757.1 UDP-2,3-diacylglucosamine diphosphatase [Moraxella sp. K2450]MDH9219249.1 UDP-2,3-diacylglucosamine diphosphatase [Moraxella lacunata]MDI4483221.1 UDP-2,3-diacylglucosamine diphosphatase [Moraxella lacunata]